MCGQNTEFLVLNLTVHIIYGVRFNSKAQESQIKFAPKDTSLSEAARSENRVNIVWTVVMNAL